MARQPPPADRPALPKAVLIVEPVEFRVDPQSAVDNPYMEPDADVNENRAWRQSKALADAIEAVGVPVIRVPGRPETPDDVFPNNVFATVPGRFVIGAMRHSHRQLEAEREDIRKYFSDQLGYETVDLSNTGVVAELTGAMVLDRARGIGLCGMTPRVDEAGLRAMHEAFDLRLSFAFDLAPEEYHTNVVMQVLASRACVLCPSGFADRGAVDAIAGAFPDRALLLDQDEKNAFAGNCIALTDSDLFLSQTAADALRPASRTTLESWGFTLHAVDVSEIELAGGSVRCMVAEVF